MAYLSWIPASTKLANLQDITDIPVIFDDNDNYLDGLNLYAQRRCRGRIALNQGHTEQIGVRRLGRQSILGICYRLTNFASWLECEEAHPLQGVMTYEDAEPWHISLLYREAMVSGYWTQEYWATGNDDPLNYPSTIAMRLKEATTCMEFLHREGLVAWKNRAEPDIAFQDRSAAAAEDALVKAIPPLLRVIPAKRKYNRRADPSDWSPLTPDELREIYRCIKTASVRFAMLLFFTSGLRLAELVNNTLVHGELFNCPTASRKGRQKASDIYQLRYDLNDDDMIGVMPSPDVAFQPNPPVFFYQRVRGKGKKVRKVAVLAIVMRDMWRWYVNGRAKLLKTYSAPSSVNFLLNERGRPLKEWNIAYALRKAKKAAEEALGTSILLTPHVLRHTFARVFLEANILASARDANLDPKKLTIDQVEEFALGPLLSLKELLGHSLLKDTMRYLRQFAAAWLGFQYLKVFADAVGETLDDLA